MKIKNSIINYLVGIIAGILCMSFFGYAFAQYKYSTESGIGVLFNKLSSDDSNGSNPKTYRLNGENIADNTITSAEIKDGAITSEKIKDSTLTNEDIALNTIIGADIHNNFSLWNKNTNGDIYYNNGNVGIGTNNPNSKLDIYGNDANINGITIGRGGGNNILNTTVGTNSLKNNTSGTNNIALGYNAGANITSGSNNISIGNNTTGNASNANSINIGNVITGNTGTNKSININGTVSVKKFTATQNIVIDKNSDGSQYITKEYIDKITNNGNVYLQQYQDITFGTEYSATKGGFIVITNDVEGNANCTHEIYINGEKVIKTNSSNWEEISFSTGIPHGGKFKVIKNNSCGNSTVKFATYGTDRITAITNTATTQIICNGATHVENDKECHPNTRNCYIPNGYGTQHWSGSWGTCNLVSCNGGYHQSGNSCISNTRYCNVTNGYGSETWNGSYWSGCNITGCSYGYKLIGGQCQSCVFRDPNEEPQGLGGALGAPSCN